MACLLITGCNGCRQDVQSVSGVKMAESGSVSTDSKGHTIEQANIIERLKQDNTPGSIKHLYIISAYSGQVLIYSPVRGKVTSSDKRLSPRKITGVSQSNSGGYMPSVKVGDTYYSDDELPAEDGTFGGSDPYISWFSPSGQYHQQYLGGGQIIHISDQPMNVKGVVITTEAHKD